MARGGVASCPKVETGQTSPPGPPNPPKPPKPPAPDPIWVDCCSDKFDLPYAVIAMEISQ